MNQGRMEIIVVVFLVVDSFFFLSLSLSLSLSLFSSIFTFQLSSSFVLSAMSTDDPSSNPQDNYYQDDTLPERWELESLCMQCGQQGITKCLVRDIPFFQRVICMSFDCPHCGNHNNQASFPDLGHSLCVCG